MKSIVLTGFMGAGKSLIGRMLARELDREFIDMDRAIEEETGLSIREIFLKYGESHFRDLERQLVIKLEGRTGLVIATGGGTLMNPLNFADLRRNGTIIYLKVDLNTALERVGRSAERPLMSRDREDIEKLFLQREPFYRQADIIIETSHLRPAEVVERVMRALEDMWRK